MDENGQHLGEAMLLAYVDDLLLISSSEDVEQVVMKTIGDIVPMKSTGLILPSREGGGKTTFIGRELIRNPYESAVYIMVRPEYLLSTFEEYGLKKEVKACTPRKDGSESCLSTALHFDGREEFLVMVHSFSDASHGPYRFNGRRGITGGVTYFENGLVKSSAKQQQCTSYQAARRKELYAVPFNKSPKSQSR